MLASILSGVAGSLISGGLNYLGASTANRKARDLADAQMYFQRVMRDTQHQAEVADLKAAGLNPVLSATHGGAAVPGGASAPVVNELSGVGEAAEGIVSSALAVKAAREQIALLQAQKKKTDMETTESGTRILQNEAVTQLTDIQRKIANDQFDIQHVGKPGAMEVKEFENEAVDVLKANKILRWLLPILGYGSSALDTYKTFKGK